MWARKGSGKTRLLCRLAALAARARRPVLYVSSRRPDPEDIPPVLPGLWTYYPTDWGEPGAEEIEEIVADVFAPFRGQGAGLLLVDEAGLYLGPAATATSNGLVRVVSTARNDGLDVVLADKALTRYPAYLRDGVADVYVYRPWVDPVGLSHIESIGGSVAPLPRHRFRVLAPPDVRIEIGSNDAAILAGVMKRSG